MQHMVSNEVDLEGYFRIFNGFFIVSFRSGLSLPDSMLNEYSQVIRSMET